MAAVWSDKSEARDKLPRLARGAGSIPLFADRVFRQAPGGSWTRTVNTVSTATRCGFSTARTRTCRSSSRMRPRLIDNLDEESETHFRYSQRNLDSLWHRVRGQFASGSWPGLLHPHGFEWATDELGSQSAVCGGGALRRIGGGDWRSVDTGDWICPWTRASRRAAARP